MSRFPIPRYARSRATARRPRRTARLASFVGGLALCGTGLVATTAGATQKPHASDNLNVVGYSVVGPAYSALEAAFQKTTAGSGVTFTNTFGPSGTESKAVAAGLPADIVNFSGAEDMERLVSKKLVSANWDDNWYQGFVTDSIVVFGVPKGNPDHIKNWNDLIDKPGIRIFTPNPYSSGSAQWNIMSALGAIRRQGKSLTAQYNYLDELLARSVVQDTSAANELNDFLADEPSHKTDVLLDYESDIYQAVENGDNISYVIPPQSINIQNPIAVTANTQNPTAANAFLSYLLSKAGQEIWASFGFRPVLPNVVDKLRKSFPRPAKGAFNISLFGGWDNVESVYFAVPNGIVTKIESGLGQTT